MISNVEDNVVFSMVPEVRNAQDTYVKKPHMKMISFLKQKIWISNLYYDI